MLILHLQEMLSALPLLSQIAVEGVAHAFQSHMVTIKVEAQKETRAVGSRMRYCGLHHGGMILKNLGAHG